ncbi:MAG: polymorphic toxin-type HINT domain-containing protein [Gemmataceae bacterium]
MDVKINLERAHAAWQKGDYLIAGTSLLGAVSSAATFLNACFAAGTKLLTKRGWLPIEQLQVGDEVWSKPEGEPGHSGGWKAVEELFQRTGRIWHLHIGGEVIRTTGEHPFFVVGQGWTEARLLQPGDLLCSHDGSTVAVEECYDTGEYETVYNCRVAEWHTYFVGCDEWGFDVWTHNAKYGVVREQPLPKGVGGNYQKYITGRRNSEMVFWYQNTDGRTRHVQVDGLRRGWVIETKYAGKDFSSSWYFTGATADSERKLRGQMTRLLEFSKAKGVNGVKMYTTNNDAAAYFRQVYERSPALRQAMQDGRIQIVVKGFPNW